MIKIKSDKIITPRGLVDGFVDIDGGKIVGVSTKDNGGAVDCDFTGKYVSPGFIDTHTHGGAGNSFISDDPSEIARGCDFHLSRGTTGIAPTVSAAPIDEMERAAECISEVKRKRLSKANVLGAHFEGPYLSKAQCGGQCPSYITLPVKSDYKRIVGRFGGDIARWTFAPENDDGSFCRFLTDNGIIASIGHSDAKYADVMRAVENGSTLVTHLYSCTSTVTRDHGFRSLGVIESAFLIDGLNVEIIADGKHLPKELVEMTVKIKGVDKVALITDSLTIAGTDIKSGTIAGTDFIVEDGVCKLTDRSAFAGSIAAADDLIRFTAFDCGFGIERAVKMMTDTPAKIMRLNKGRIEKGFDADIIVFDGNIKVSDVFVGGNKVI